MPEIFKGGFTVSNNNGAVSSGQRPSVIVRNADKTILAALYSEKGKVLQRLRAKVLTPEWSEFVRQLIASNVPPDVIDDIVKVEGAVEMYKRQNTLCEVLCCMQELIDYATAAAHSYCLGPVSDAELQMIERAKLAMGNVQGRVV